MTEEDLEIKAMGAVASALAGLDSSARGRVLEWAAKRFDVKIASGAGAGTSQISGERGADGSARRESSENAAFQDFVDLVDATGPGTDAERALIGGYWFQVVRDNSDFQAQEVNTALKDVGHGIGNITEAFTTLQGRKPALVRQVAKSGRSRQARKKYKLTTAGTATVRQMLARGDGPEEES